MVKLLDAVVAFKTVGGPRGSVDPASLAESCGDREGVRLEREALGCLSEVVQRVAFRDLLVLRGDHLWDDARVRERGEDQKHQSQNEESKIQSGDAVAFVLLRQL